MGQASCLNPLRGLSLDREENSLNLKCLINCIQAEVWVKLCAYRNLFKATRIDQGLSFYRGMVADNPAQLIWGSDWPL